jgi:hypothetical protein
MHKTEVDYSNTIIYKIYCNDENIKELYVGHTTNFVQRKYAHKQSSININMRENNTKLYKTIRENGGWDNWSMEIVNFFNCENQQQAKMKEQEYFISLNATLNSVEPFSKKIKPPYDNQVCKIYNCETCNLEFKNLHLLNIHKSAIHNFEKKGVFYCKNCHHSFTRKNDYERHIMSMKHVVNKKRNLRNPPDNQSYKCSNCSIIYKTRTGLWKHSRKCVGEEVKLKEPKLELCELKEMCSVMMKTNADFQRLMLESNQAMIESQIKFIEHTNNTIANIATYKNTN